MNNDELAILADYTEAIAEETSADSLRECYRVDRFIYISDELKDSINERKRKRIEEIENE